MPTDSNDRRNANYHPLVRQVARGLRRRCEVPPEAHILVAVSGGADSVALLRALALLAPRRKFNLKLTIAHINHHLRGASSDGDALFVKTLANQLKLPCHITGIHLDAGGTTGRAKGSGGNLEAAARDARYEALATIAQHCGASYIATAHHADDQLETLLMRIIRGASIQGLRGIAPSRPLQNDHSSLHITLIRPMLEAQRDTARTFLTMLGQSWREDESNTDTTRTRNRLRHELIPLLKDIKHDVANRAVQLTDHFAQVHDLIEKQMPDIVSTNPQSQSQTPNLGSPFTLPRDQARKLPPLILTQMLRNALIQAGANPDQLPGHALRPILQAIRDTAGNTRTFTLANQTTLTLTRDTIQIQ